MAATLRRQFRHPVDILIAVREQKEIDLRIALQSRVHSRDKGVLAIPSMSLGEIPCCVIISFQVGQRELLGSPLLKRRHIIADCEGGSPLFAERRASIPENSLGQGNDYCICQAGEQHRNAYCLRLLHFSRSFFIVSRLSDRRAASATV